MIDISLSDHLFLVEGLHIFDFCHHVEKAFGGLIWYLQLELQKFTHGSRQLFVEVFGMPVAFLIELSIAEAIVFA